MKLACGFANCQSEAVFRILGEGEEVSQLQREYCATHIGQALHADMNVAGVFMRRVELIHDSIDADALGTTVPVFLGPKNVTVMPISGENFYEVPEGVEDGFEMFLINQDSVNKVMSPNVTEDVYEKPGGGWGFTPLVVRAKTTRRVKWQPALRKWVAF